VHVQRQIADQFCATRSEPSPFSKRHNSTREQTRSHSQICACPYLSRPYLSRFRAEAVYACPLFSSFLSSLCLSPFLSREQTLSHSQISACPYLSRSKKGTTQRANKHDRTLKSVPVPIFHVSEPKQFMPVPFSLFPFLFFLFSLPMSVHACRQFLTTLTDGWTLCWLHRAFAGQDNRHCSRQYFEIVDQTTVSQVQQIVGDFTLEAVNVVVVPVHYLSNTG